MFFHITSLDKGAVCDITVEVSTCKYRQQHKKITLGVRQYAQYVLLLGIIFS